MSYAPSSLLRPALLVSLLLFSLGTQAAIVPQAPQIKAKAYILMDANSGEILVEYNADNRLAPASLTKMMTAYVADASIANGTITVDDETLISVKAWRTGGSKMFIREGTRVSVSDLLHGIIIQSGNDASVALAEHIAGSEDAFADMMNQYAANLGMENSQFKSATGLDKPDQYTSARDMAKLARGIIYDYPKHYSLYKKKSFTYNGISQNNRNKLLWRDPSVDGLKTGHTDEAGYSLVSSAKKNDMRLIAVVMGADSINARANENQKLLTWGFRFFESHKIYSQGETISSTPIWYGVGDEVKLGAQEDIWITIPKGSRDSIQAEMVIDPVIEAPISSGQALGNVEILQDGKLLKSAPVMALDSVDEGSVFKKSWDYIYLLAQQLLS